MKNTVFLVFKLIVFGCNNHENNKSRVDDSLSNIQLERDLEMYKNLWDVFLAGDPSAINTQTFTEDAVVVTAQENITGIYDQRDFYLNYTKGFSEIEFEIIDAFGLGNKLIKHYNFKGKHTGDFFGIPASGNYLDLSGTTIVTMRGGRIAKEQYFFDMKSLYISYKKGK